jgi:hypothetical protein
MADKPQAEGLKAALELTKQIITLSTGVITLTLTFLEKIVQPTAASASRHVPWSLLAAWIFFGLAIVAAVWTLMAVTGSLNALDRKANGGELNDDQQEAVRELADSTHLRTPAVIMVLLFLAGIGLTILTGLFLRS